MRFWKIVVVFPTKQIQLYKISTFLAYLPNPFLRGSKSLPRIPNCFHVMRWLLLSSQPWFAFHIHIHYPLYTLLWNPLIINNPICEQSFCGDNWVQAGAEGERNKVVLAEAPERERETGKLCSSVTASQAPFREHNIAGNNTFSCKMSRLSRIYPSKIEKTLYLWKSLLCKIPNQGTPISVLTAHGSLGFNCPQSLISTFILVVIIVMMMKIITIITIDGVEGPLSPTLEFPGLVGPASWGLGAGWWGWWW